MAQDIVIYVVHGTRTRLLNPDVKLGARISDDFHQAVVNGQAGLLTQEKIISHQRYKFFVPDGAGQTLSH